MRQTWLYSLLVLQGEGQGQHWSEISTDKRACTVLMATRTCSSALPGRVCWENLCLAPDLALAHVLPYGDPLEAVEMIDKENPPAAPRQPLATDSRRRHHARGRLLRSGHHHQLPMCCPCVRPSWHGSLGSAALMLWKEALRAGWPCSLRSSSDAARQNDGLPQAAAVASGPQRECGRRERTLAVDQHAEGHVNVVARMPCARRALHP